jgi:hypothetical protein
LPSRAPQRGVGFGNTSRQKPIFAQDLKAIAPVQTSREKYFSFVFTEIMVV